MSSRRGLRAVFVCGSYLGLSFLALIHAWEDPTHKVQIASGDLTTYVWGLRWVSFAITHGYNPFFSDWMNYPAGVNLLNNTTPIFLGVLITPVTLSLGPVVSYNVLQTLAFAVSAAAAYLLLRRWTAWWPAAFVGGLVYGFSPYMVGAGWSHIAGLFIPFPPLILLCLDELIVRQRGSAARWGTALGLLAVAQFFCSSELLADTAEMCLIGVVVLAILYRREVARRFRHASIGLVTGAVVSLVLLAYPVWFAVFGPQHVSIEAPADLFSADLLGPIVPNSNQLLGTPGLRALGDQFSGYVIHYAGRDYLLTDAAYLGLPLVLILVVTVIRFWRLAMVRVFGLMTVIAFVFSLGPTLKVAHSVTGIKLPARVFQHLPLLTATLPYRYAIFVSLGAAVLLAVAVDRLHQHKPGCWQSRVPSRAVTAVVVLIALAPLVPTLPYSMMDLTPPEYFRGSVLSTVPAGGVLLSYPFPGPLTAETMAWQASTGFQYRIVGGYAFVQNGQGGVTLADNPSDTQRILFDIYRGEPAPAVTPTLRERVLGDLRAWRVATIVVVNSAPSSTSVVSIFTDILGVPPQRQQDVALWRGLGHG